MNKHKMNKKQSRSGNESCMPALNLDNKLPTTSAPVATLSPPPPPPPPTTTTTTTTETTSSQDHQKQAHHYKSSALCRHHQRRPSSTMFNIGRKSVISGFVCLILAVFLLSPPTTNQLVEGAKIKKAVKSLAKGFMYQQLSTRKNFLPLPVPIPVPIEINEDPIYLKGKPKYVNIYKQPKPTPQPVVKPTTVYHMPIYSPTYEYMSMDPMNSMYGASMMYHPYAQSPSSYKSYVNTDSDSTSSGASATHGDASSSSGANFNDYDDESGSYYVRKSAAAARRRKLVPGEYASSFNLHRNDADHHRHFLHQHIAGQRSNFNQDGSLHSGDMMMFSDNQHGGVKNNEQQQQGEEEESDIETVQPNDDESYDHEGEGASWVRSRSSTHRGARVKRQVYYQSGYDENKNCEGFPLEINVRSKITLDQIFPIRGKSQIKKCVKINKPLLPPVQQEHY